MLSYLAEFLQLMLQAPFRMIVRISKRRGPSAKHEAAPLTSAHRIRIVESGRFQEMGPEVAKLLRWSYLDLRATPFELGDAKSNSNALREMTVHAGSNLSKMSGDLSSDVSGDVSSDVSSDVSGDVSGDMGGDMGEDIRHDMRREVALAARRQRRVVFSCSQREVQAGEPDGLTVVVDDVCDLESLTPTLCLQNIMLKLRPKTSDLAKPHSPRLSVTRSHGVGREP